MIRGYLVFLALALSSGCTPITAPNAREISPAANLIKPVPQPDSVTHAAPPDAPDTLSIPAATAAETAAVATPVSAEVSPPPTPDPGQQDIWQRIRAGFAMRELKSPLVARHEQWYAGRPDYVERMTERAQRYLHFIVEEVEKRGMPMEIALLPMIESAFNPGAYSRSRASGIWQFIPSTGKNFGLQQNWWYDGRRDILAATTGALDYLQKLHDEFGDWELALAAYNCGENAVRRAQQRNRKSRKPVDYASLKLLPETRNYVPKLLAIKNIVNQPAAFGLTLQPIPDKPYFDTVVTDRHIDVKLAAELADISVDEFMALNPAHNRPVILQEHAETLLLPVDKVDVFRANLEHYSNRLVTWQAYPTRKGERLDKLAEQFGMTVAQLCSINGLPPRAMVSNGQEMLVPLNDPDSDAEFAAFNTHLVPFDPLLANAVTHIVRRGDTLSGIARRYRVRLSSLQSWNRGVKILRPGQRIYVVQPPRPARKKPLTVSSASAGLQPVAHTVQ